MNATGSTIYLLGFGKIGQAIGVMILRSGFSLLAIDTDSRLLDDFQSGRFDSTEPGVTEILTNAFASGQLKLVAGTDQADSDGTAQTHSRLKHDQSAEAGQARKGFGSDGTPAAIVVTLPFGLSKEKTPDADSFIDGLRAVLPLMRDKQLLVIETSLPVGFCRLQLVPAFQAAGLIHGRDYLLAHSPERIKSGTMLRQLNAIPKVVGGIDPEATRQAVELYRRFFPGGNVAIVPDIESAEMVKMAGMMYRDVNIALANQLAVFAGETGIDLVSLLPLLNSDGEAKLLQPGIGVGGHCTPVYPYFMIDAFKREGLVFSLGETARKVNESMAMYAAGIVSGYFGREQDLHTGRVMDPVNVGSPEPIRGAGGRSGPGSPGDVPPSKQVTVLGLAFRPGVKEDANSPAYPLVQELVSQGYQVLVHDPMYSAAELADRGLTPAADPYAEGSEAVILVTMHEMYAALEMESLFAGGVRLLVDGRNAIDRDVVLGAGIHYRGIGS